MPTAKKSDKRGKKLNAVPAAWSSTPCLTGRWFLTCIHSNAPTHGLAPILCCPSQPPGDGGGIVRTIPRDSGSPAPTRGKRVTVATVTAKCRQFDRGRPEGKPYPHRFMGCQPSAIGGTPLSFKTTLKICPVRFAAQPRPRHPQWRWYSSVCAHLAWSFTASDKVGRIRSRRREADCFKEVAGSGPPHVGGYFVNRPETHPGPIMILLSPAGAVC